MYVTLITINNCFTKALFITIVMSVEYVNKYIHKNFHL